MKKLILLFSIATLIASCSKYGSVALKYPTHPAAQLPENIKSIAVVNRSQSEKTGGNSMAEAIVSGEIAGSDKRASNQCLIAVYDGLNGWRETNIVLLEKRKLVGTGTRETPELLDWDMVKHICDSVKSDALLVLETFDSNSDLLASAVNTAFNTVVTGGPVVPNVSQVQMNVISYWRLYDPVNKKVIDQYRSSNQLFFDGGPLGVAVPSPDALAKTAYSAGDEYIQRFLPQYDNVQRDLYKKGKGREKQQFKTAFRKAEVANWDGAIEAWTKLLNSTKNNKNAGRACLNIAVAHEVLGNTKEAMVWAKKAYEDYGNKLAKHYMGLLNIRLETETNIRN
jgi:hypothetical protein